MIKDPPSVDWISASATRAWCMQDPILDWLNLYGEANGFVPDTKRDGWDPQLDMGLFLQEKGRAFEAAVMRCVEEKFQVVKIADRETVHRRNEERANAGEDYLSAAHDPEFAERTLQAMRDGAEIIYQGVLHDAERQTCGVPDLLVRSDVLNRLVSHPCISEIDEHIPANGQDFHYRVVDIKFTNLGLTAKEMMGNDASDRRRKAQLLIYNRSLGSAQGYEPPVAYLLGRGFSYTQKSVDYRGDSCFDRLAPASMLDVDLHQLVEDALIWVRTVRDEGKNWKLLPSPTVPELHPNMSNTQDGPWHMVKKEVAEELGELTLLWQVSPTRRPKAHRENLYSYRDGRCCGSVFGLADSYAAKLDQILEINRGYTDKVVRPDKVSSDEIAWRQPNPLEFYVDFETVTDLDDDFSKIPKKGGNTLIYMIGCGHMEEGRWQFRVFTCDRLTSECERSIIDDWHAHMEEVQRRLWPDGKPLIFHWSHAEQSFLNTAYNSARKRHSADWPDLNWYDFLVKVMREEPVTVKGALAFGLKSIAKAMHRNGLIATEWTNGPGDGLQAMVGAWRCDEKARSQGCSMRDLPLMKSIEDYNEVDCRVMQEIISYLRAHH